MTMNDVQAEMHNHHLQMATTLERYTNDLQATPITADVTGLVTFLKHDLLPHAQGEEAFLYPAVDSLIKCHGSSTATMSIDHEYILRYVNQIEVMQKQLTTYSGEHRGALEERLKTLVVQLQAIFALHLEKEERVYMPLFETHLPAAEQRHILDQMHGYSEETMTIQTTIDVRQIPPAKRHPLIFDTFAALQVGEVFRLINDHDPKPLFYQFKFEYEGQFIWEYVESGPQVWQVNIGKIEVK